MRIIIGAAVAVLLSVSTVEAQQKQIVPPASRPRSGRAASPTPPPQETRPTVVQPTYTVSAPTYVVQGDGSVILNYGNGYERVVHRCATKAPAPADPYARDVFGRIPPPPGIAALQAGSRGQPSGQMPARNAKACYRADGGRVEVVGQ
jgi:hypothetical protein